MISKICMIQYGFLCFCSMVKGEEVFLTKAVEKKEIIERKSNVYKIKYLNRNIKITINSLDTRGGSYIEGMIVHENELKIQLPADVFNYLGSAAPSMVNSVSVVSSEQKGSYNISILGGDGSLHYSMSLAIKRGKIVNTKFSSSDIEPCSKVFIYNKAGELFKIVQTETIQTGKEKQIK